MKQITKNTILQQGDKTYQPVEVDGIICWIDKSTLADEIIAQSQSKLEGIPVISLDRYVDEAFLEKHGLVSMSKTTKGSIGYREFVSGYNSNPNQYNLKDIEKAIDLARLQGEESFLCKYSDKEILEQINQISVIEVDEQFNIVSYE
jgi:hypothetical protein